jgi:hypothetical protein
LFFLLFSAPSKKKITGQKARWIDTTELNRKKRKKQTMPKLKFLKPTETIPLRSSKGQGLSGDTVKLKGNKKKNKHGAFSVQGKAGKDKKKKKSISSKRSQASKSTKGSSKRRRNDNGSFLRTGSSSYPDKDRDPQSTMVRRMARDESESDSDSPPSYPTVAPPVNNRDGLVLPRNAPPANQFEGSGAFGVNDEVDDSEPDFSDDEYDGESIISDFSSISSSSTMSSIPMDRTLSNMRGKSGGSAAAKSAPGSIADEAEKQDILARLHIVKARGIRLTKNYTAKSTLQELRMEMGRIEHEAETNRSVQRLRRWLMAGVSGAEYASSSNYAPKVAKNRLHGFSTYVLDSIEDYDPAFERMSEKYGGVLGIGSTGNPLADIAILMLTQMCMFMFVEHKSEVKPPTADEVKKQYPDMVRTVAKEMADKMRAEEKGVEMHAARVREQQRQQWLYTQQQQQQQPQQALYSGGFDTHQQGGQQQQQPQSQLPLPVYTQSAPSAQPMQPPSINYKERELPPLTPVQAPPQIDKFDINSESTSLLDTPLTMPYIADAVGAQTVGANAASDSALFDLQEAGQDENIEEIYNRPSAAAPGSAFDVSSLVQEVDAIQRGISAGPFPAPESLPAVPFKRTKSVEMPVSTRAGKGVKINNVPSKPAMKRKSSESEAQASTDDAPAKTAITIG